MTRPRGPRRTPLYEAHRRLGREDGRLRRLVDAGQLPDAESSTSTARRARRSACSTSATWARSTSAAPRAAEAVQRLVTNDVAKLGRRPRALHRRLPAHGRHRRRPHRLPHARRPLPDRRQRLATIEKDVAWFREHVGRRGATSIDASDETGAHRVPGAGGRSSALQPLTTRRRSAQLRALRLRRRRDVAGVPASIARTGYTGEDGFEIFCARRRRRPRSGTGCSRPPARVGRQAGRAWARATRCASRRGCRSTATTSTRRRRRSRPGSAGSSSSTAPTSSAATRCARRRRAGVDAQAGRLRDDRPRHRAPRLSRSTTPTAPPIGEVTSGGPAPTLEKNIGLGYVPAALDVAGHAAFDRLPRQAGRRRGGERSVLQAREARMKHERAISRTTSATRRTTSGPASRSATAARSRPSASRASRSSSSATSRRSSCPRRARR